MKPTEDMIREHGSIKALLRILDKISAHLETGKQSVKAEDLVAIMDFVETFVNKCHHGKEDLLFRSLEGSGVLEEDYAAVLMAEHKLGHDYIEGMERALEFYKKDGSGAAAFVDWARSYVRLLDHHADRENQEYFPLADTILDPQMEKAMEVQFQELEQRVLGPDGREKYQALLARLEKEYLNI